MGRFNIIRPLLDKGAKLEISDYVRLTSKCDFCEQPSIICIFLLQSGATPLHYAVNYGHEDLVWQLLEKISKFNNHIIDMQNEVRLYYCCYVIFLCSLSFSYGHEQAGETALHLACSQQNVNIVRLLLRYGASRDIRTKV